MCAKIEPVEDFSESKSQRGKDINKSRIWLCVTYPESMRPDWQECCEDLFQGLPFAYCIHDKDKQTGHEEEDRKTHVHWILVFSNTNGSTTRKHAESVLNQLSAPGKKCFPYIEPCLNVRNAYDYLIHETESARKKEKLLYPKEERIESANFDIVALEHLSEADKNRMCQELCDWIVDNDVMNMSVAYVGIRDVFGPEYFPIMKANNAFLSRLCMGNYQEEQRKKIQEENRKPRCCICRSENVIKDVMGNPAEIETVDGKMYVCQDCQEVVARLLTEGGR